MSSAAVANTSAHKNHVSDEGNVAQDLTAATTPTAWSNATSRVPSVTGSGDIEMRTLTLTGTETNVAMREDVPPDGGYGWVCTACVCLINAHTWGVNAAWGVFLAYYLSESTFPNATHLEYALIGGLSISQALMVTPFVALSNEKFGTRITLMIGTLLVAASMLTSSFATQVWHLFLSQGVCFGWGMGCLYITAAAILPQWFSKRRSLAVGIASSGAGFGGLAYNLGAGAGLEMLGWRWTCRILAISSLVVNLTCAVLLKDRNRLVRPNTKAFDLREYARVETWLLITWGWMTELGYIVLLYSLPNYAQSIGLNAQQGAVVGAMLNLGLGFGRPLVGWMSDSFGRINIATGMTALCGVFCLAIWVPSNSYGVLILFAIAAGTATGTFWGTVIPVTAEITGMQRLPSAFGMICLPLVLPTTFAEGMALELVAAKGYRSAQIFTGCMFLAGAAAAWLLRSWQIHQLEKREHLGQTSSKLWLSVHGLLQPRKV
ncbi:Putative major facilitator superfamily, MFS transporter superfamily [Septoria linicola]|uniref:Major facilitator superfamily, MFS transporter superfamily n=1 Tax=Septoria linicola TaxID=215465 RepID=A0A9Q9ANB7_9PEZI|nr:putative major facilitator superfamily, MFS transporter superfamily [Septoria linicola]USW52642.1 Putative major facilitator superfamily, MFS transporter superfamily [Septoria linicola]